MASTEGYIEFEHGSVPKPCSIWYKISGPWPVTSSFPPLVILHGGPGYTHDYMLPLEDLCHAPHNMTMIFFDQVGSGRSTHFQEKLLDYEFWSVQFFLDQVKAVLEHFKIQDRYNLLGHSWGGMLGTLHAARQPQGLDRLIIAHAPVAAKYWTEKYIEFREQMPDRHRKVLKVTRTVKSSLDADYLEAIGEFYKRHFINVDPIPEELVTSWNYINEDRTASLSALGPDEFEMSGSIAGFTAVDEIHNIKAKTLVLNGVDEGCDHKESINLFLSRINDCTHRTFEGSTHFAHFEECEEFMRVVAKFLEP